MRSKEAETLSRSIWKIRILAESPVILSVLFRRVTERLLWWSWNVCESQHGLGIARATIDEGPDNQFAIAHCIPAI